MDFSPATLLGLFYEWAYVILSAGLAIAVAYFLLPWRRRRGSDTVIRTRKRDRIRKWMGRVGTKLGPPDGRARRGLRATRRLLGTLRGPATPGREALVPKDPPAILLEEAEILQSDLSSGLPPEMRLTVKSMRIFGHFDDSVFSELYKHIELVKLDAEQTLFSAGEKDDSMFIVQDGLDAPDAPPTLMNVLGPGDLLASLLSVADILCGNESKFKTLSARAVKPSTVIRIPVTGLQQVIEKHPRQSRRLTTASAMRQLMQVITVRLQRLTFSTLHKLLGLTSELVKSVPASAPYDIDDRMRATMGSNLAAVVGTDVAKFLGGVLTDNFLEIEKYNAGESIIAQGQGQSDLYFVVRGKVAIRLHNEDNNTEVKLREPTAGCFFGELALLSDVESFSSAIAISETVLGRVNRAVIKSIMDIQPQVVARLARSVLLYLSPLVRRIDFAVDWIRVESGRAVYRQGDAADSVYIVLAGRLRSVRTRNGHHKEMVAEFGRNEIVGEMEVLTDTERATTLLAVRDSELAKVPAHVVNFAKLKHPSALVHLMNTLSQRMLDNLTNESASSSGILWLTCTAKDIHGNLATVTLLPVNGQVPITLFAEKLVKALSAIGPTLHLSSKNITQHCGRKPYASLDDYQLANWLGMQEDHHRIIIYEADADLSRWTRWCFRQADCILVVGVGGTAPCVSPAEEQLEALAARAQKELVMLYPPSAKTPSGTAEWLNIRSWCNGHHNIRCCSAVLPGESDKPSPPKSIMLTDYGRLARRLTGTSVGLVVGGGGARGLAHFGIIRSFEEAGIPIDMIGGTSIGAFVGGLYAEEMGVQGTNMDRRARYFAQSMDSKLSLISDLTYPVTAMFTGRAFNRKVNDVFRDRLIEDLWIPFFCVTTDITTLTVRVHTHGLLWRYVRASMTLSGYLPPIGDPHDNHLLLDGGYIDNLPVDVMRNRGAHTIFAVDVGAKESQDLTNYGDELSGWWLLWRRWNPLLSPPKIPDMQDIASRLAYISCNMQLNELARRGGFEYVRPPIEGFKTLQWSKFDEIEKVGYDHMQPKIREWIRLKMFPFLQHIHGVESVPAIDRRASSLHSATSDWARSHHFKAPIGSVASLASVF